MPLKMPAQTTAQRTMISDRPEPEARAAAHEPYPLPDEEPREELGPDAEEQDAKRELLVEACPEGHHDAR